MTERLSADRARYLLGEILGCFEEYKAMPCTSLSKRLMEACERASREDRAAATKGEGT